MIYGVFILALLVALILSGVLALLGIAGWAGWGVASFYPAFLVFWCYCKAKRRRNTWD